MHDGKVPSITEVIWPPSKDAWLLFLTEGVLRYQATQGSEVGNVCDIANKYWSQHKQLLVNDIDPRVLYSLIHRQAMGSIKRACGSAVHQVKPISKHEARNATHYQDCESLRGISACAAFSIGTGMGGRRPRTLTAIRLSDLKLTVGVGRKGGTQALVPHLPLEFREEKHDDIRGPRRGYDQPHADSYHELVWNSCGYWIYRLLLVRGVFQCYDPILSACVDDVLHIQPECLHFYLFCEVGHDYWVDTAAVRVHMISTWNRNMTLLLAMGCTPRGFSAHRSGFVSGTCILAIMNAQGRELPEGTLEVLIRAGGWEAVTGARTVLRVYARSVIDKYMDSYGLSLGHELGEEGWAARKAMYLGEPSFPSRPLVVRGRCALPLQPRLLAWRSEAWMQHMNEMNTVCADIMTAA